jgi:hypothetical protein
MTPEERQLLTGLADRIKNAPAQQRDEEAAALIRDLVQARPDTAYILAQTTLMQDFALRTAQAQIADLQRQLADARQAAPASGGSFLGGLFGGGSSSVPAAGSVPPANPWGRPQPQAYAQQPAYTQPVYAAPVLQPGQTSGFLQNAAQTAVGVAGGMLLFEGMESLFSGHHGGWGGGYGGGPWGGGGYGPTENITETVVNNNYYDAPGGQQPADFTQDPANLQDDGLTDTGFDDGGDFSNDDDQSI